MAEQQGETRQIQIRIDESKMHSSYANTIRTTSTMDEVILDFGVNLPQQTQGGEQMMVFGVGSRVIMNWAGAKRLAISLGQLITQYEAANGEISLQGKGKGGSPRLSQ